MWIDPEPTFQTISMWKCETGIGTGKGGRKTSHARPVQAVTTAIRGVAREAVGWGLLVAKSKGHPAAEESSQKTETPAQQKKDPGT